MPVENEALASTSTDLDRAPHNSYSLTENHRQGGHLIQRLDCSDEEPEHISTETDTKVQARMRHLRGKVRPKLHLKASRAVMYGDPRVFDRS
jgi:hypothetical protein